MTREEIRTGIEKLIIRWTRDNYPIGKETFIDLVKHIQEFEDTQGVVIKVDELAEYANYNDLTRELDDRVKYALVEPLIEDAKEVEELIEEYRAKVKAGELEDVKLKEGE